MMLYPLLFRPILKPRVWGGTRLAKFGKAVEGTSGDLPIGESWEVADLPPEIEDGQSIVANGSLAGMTLRDAIATHGKALLGHAHHTPDSRFPILIKYLDARENLSVQVHPDRAYVEKHPEAHLKDEAWVIIDCAPDAVIYKGLTSELDEPTLRAHIENGEIIDDLIAIPVAPGECHYLPSGTVHALGAGVMVAEVQTPSDTTFRMYDWGRNSRQLHIDEAMEVIFHKKTVTPALGEREHPLKDDPPMCVDHIKTTFLLKTEHFAIERIDATDDASIAVVTNDVPEVWMVLKGRGEIACDIAGTDAIALSAGTTVLIPAALPEWQATLSKGASLLRITLASPLQGLLA